MAVFDIGAQRRAAGEKTKGRVEAYFQANPFATQRECARDLGLNIITVGRYFKLLRAERIERLAAGERA